MKTPKSVDIDITSRCNLRCKYCYHRTSPADTGNELPTADWLEFFRELAECAVMDVTIGGGEPFIRNDLPELVDGIVANRMRFSILSNGGLIKPEVAKHLAATGRCNYVQISVDGSRPEVHDRFRGAGAFEGAMRGLRILQEAGVHVTSRVTIHKYNIADLENIAHLLLDQTGMGSFSTNSASFQGLARTNDDVLLSPSEQCDAMIKILDLANRYRGRITSAAGPLSLAKGYQEMEQARLAGRGIPGRGFLTGCGCMWSKLAVRPDGTYVPCGMLSHIALGRINQDRLIDIWQNHPDFLQLRERYKIPLSNFPECADCAYQMTCTGNCPAGGYARTGEVYAPNSDDCLKRFLADGGRFVAVP
ncbi:MAG: SynChlorMet cassette radical SAM/SPASM protein ScmE [Deltaproteobacteria bacterium]|nr:SynChlorMet cassette radical SAM/SPASM protein ScmE [Deltaproteobacteria bacterium]